MARNITKSNMNNNKILSKKNFECCVTRDEEKKRHTNLKKILEELSSSQNLEKSDIKQYHSNLTKVYCDGFRHLYSEVFSYITEIDNTTDKSLEVLMQNMRFIYEENLELLVRELSPETQNAKCYSKIRKLYDHINLDISRLRYMRAIAETHEKDKKELSETIARTKKDVSDISEHALGSLKEVSAKIDRMQREYISILGIFASIVLTFVSGMIFSSSVLQNIHNATIYRLSFVIVLLGFILVNILALLMNFVRDIVYPDRKNFFYVKNLNYCMLFVFIVIILAWLFDVSKARLNILSWLSDQNICIDIISFLFL